MTSLQTHQGHPTRLEGALGKVLGFPLDQQNLISKETEAKLRVKIHMEPFKQPASTSMKAMSKILHSQSNFQCRKSSIINISSSCNETFSYDFCKIPLHEAQAIC